VISDTATENSFILLPEWSCWVGAVGWPGFS